jgi:signal transduction histidine kinase
MRLRWQLTLAHLAVIALTLVSLVAAGAIALVGFARADARRSPASVAETIALGVGRLLDRPDASGAERSALLKAVVDGEVRLFPLSLRGAQRAPGGGDALRPALAGLEYLVLVDRGGVVVASSDPARQPVGAPFASPLPGWEATLAAALGGARGSATLSLLPPDAGGLAIGAAPLGSRERVLVVARRQPTSTQLSLPTILAIFGVVSVATLALSSVFALAAAGSVGYLLARRLARRLEGLAAAADGLAAGDLTRRAREDSGDELGQLAARFNAMADRLGASIAALASERDRAEQALRARRELVANVSHELRTPLATLRAHLDTLAGDARGADLHALQRETERLSTLVDDLFTLSRADAGALPLTPEPLDLAAALRETVERFAPLAQRERRVTLLLQAADDLPAVRADRARLDQVLGNLLRNALRYTPEGGLVAVEAQREGEAVRVTVADTGPGIPPEDLPHLFERFYRGGDPARARDAGGAGLGLAIVRELVEAMGGRVAVDSAPGEGSRFSITLPVAVGEQAPAVAAATSA